MTEKQLNIIVTIWVALFVTGTVIQLYQIRQDKNLKNKNTNQLNSLKQISKLNFPINLLLMSIGILFLGLIAFSMLFKEIYIPGIIGLFLILCSIIFGYYSIVAILLHVQYYRLEKNREIIFDTDKKEIIIKFSKKNKIEVITESDISKIEIHQCSGNLRKPTGEYEFIRYITKSGQIHTITSLQTHITNLIGMLKSRNKQYIYKQFNWIE